MQAEAVRAFHGTIIHAHSPELERSLVPVPVASLPPQDVLGFRIVGDPELALRVIWTSTDRRTAILIEKCGPCRIVGRHVTEAFYLIRGRWTGRRPDGSPYEVRAGDFACFSDGHEDDATVHETIFKCSLYHATQPLPFEVTRGA
jgi:uncharacterized cupin superfamily protein